jgi:hypothetical protein
LNPTVNIAVGYESKDGCWYKGVGMSTYERDIYEEGFDMIVNSDPLLDRP